MKLRGEEGQIDLSADRMNVLQASEFEIMGKRRQWKVSSEEGMNANSRSPSLLVSGHTAL